MRGKITNNICYNRQKEQKTYKISKLVNNKLLELTFILHLFFIFEFNICYTCI